MEFDINKVYTSLNADELKPGSKVIVANTIDELKRYVEDYCDGLSCTVYGIMPEYFSDRFLSSNHYFNLAYLISESEEKKLKWTDLKIGDIIKKKYEDGYRFAMVIRIDTYSTEKHIELGGEWLTDEELKDWEKVED